MLANMSGREERQKTSTAQNSTRLLLSQQNQQLDSAGGCNAIITRDFVVRGSCSIPTAPTNISFLINRLRILEGP